MLVVFFFFAAGGGGVIDISPLALMKKHDFESRHLKKKVLLQTYFVIFEKKVTLSNKLLYFL